MKDEYIRREDAVDAVAFGITIASAFNTETGERIDLFAKENDELQKAIKRIHDLPSADVVPVVRCKDCEYVRKWRSEESAKKFGQVYECARGILTCPNPDDFCSYGERKE